MFVFLVVIGLSSLVFGQNNVLKNDLRNSFSKFSVTRLDTQNLLRNVKNLQSFSVATVEKTFEMFLTPHDLRSEKYFAEDTTVAGVRRLEKTSVNTYKGKIVGEADSQIRLSIDDGKVEGYFVSEGEMFFIEPAARYSKFAEVGDFIVYQQKDLVRTDTYTCHSELGKELEKGKEFVMSKAVQSPQTMNVIEIATEADFDFVNSASGATEANNKILSILNMAEGVYESELNLTVNVVFQHTWSTSDPFNGANASTLLSSFQNHWNANYPTAQYPRDTAHLFSYKPNVRAQGFAYLGVVCNNPSFAYGISGRVDTTWGWEEANFLVTTHEIAHNLGANHSDAQSSCANTLMQSQLSGNTALSFCTFSRSEVSNYVSANGSCLTAPSGSACFDFDGDNKTDVSIFRPSVGQWWYLKSSNGGNGAYAFGNSSDKLAVGDYTGDGKSDIAFWRPSNGFWYILRSEDSSFFSFPFGTSGDAPVAADFDGDGKTDPTVFRPSTGTWYISKSTGGTQILGFGVNGDIPVVADYDGDGKADVAIYRPSNGQWWIQRSTAGTFAIQFGTSTDIGVQGDYTGDGKADIAFFRPSTGEWFVLRSEDSSFFSFPFGTDGDIPAAGDYDGDSKFDPTVFRPSAATWYIQQSTAGTQILSFGLAGDKPVPNSFAP
jgi:hypothetical protein